MRAAIVAVAILTLALTPCGPAAAGVHAGTVAAWERAPDLPAFGEATAPAPEGPRMGSSFALASEMVDDGLLADRGMGVRPEKRKPSKPAEPGQSDEPARPNRLGRVPHALSGERARLMLQSLTVPGWGQASLGQRRSALVFGVLEAGVWGSFTAFRIQQEMREQTYERTARMLAGIDLGRRDEEYRRIVGFYISSDEYNQLVVRRDAANLYFGDPAAYDAYVAAHEIKGDGVWSWGSEADLLRYRAERQNAQRAIKHAHDALAAALINRLISMVHASAGGARKAADQTSWRLECVPAGGEPTAFRLGLRADF